MKRVWLGILCCALLGIGCGDDDTTSGGDDGGAAPDDSKGGAGKESGKDAGGTGAATPTEKMISAKDGGKLTTEGATLDIPAGALSKDTKVTVDTVDAADLPESSKVASTAYDFGPDGTKFEKPVSLTIDFDGKAPEGTVATLAWLDGDKWTALEDSAVDGSSVTATTLHFTTFAVVWISNDDGTGMQTAGSCAANDADSTCGGDPVGNWEFSATCVTLPPGFLEGDHPEDGGLSSCKGVKVSANFELTGAISFNKDKTYTLHSDRSGEVAASVPKMCLMGAPCPDDWMDSGDACETTMTPDSETNDESGTYAIEGHTLTTTQEGDAAGDPTDFCVDGDTITAKTVDADGTIVVYQLTRK